MKKRRQHSDTAKHAEHEEFEETNESSIVEMSLEYVNLVTARFKGASDAPEI